MVSLRCCEGESLIAFKSMSPVRQNFMRGGRPLSEALLKIPPVPVGFSASKPLRLTGCKAFEAGRAGEGLTFTASASVVL